MTISSIGVVLITYHTGSVLWYSIASILCQEGVRELIIVNNGNPDAVSSRLQALAHDDERITLLEKQGNIGFAAACNLGASHVQSDYLIFCNPDLYIPHNAVQKIVDILETYPEAWMGGTAICHPDGKEQRGSRRNKMTLSNAILDHIPLLSFFLNKKSAEPLNLEHLPSPTDPCFIYAISGAFMCIKKHRYDQVKGMDEGYFLHVEDMDFCKRINEAGGKILYIPSIKMIHKLSSSQVSSWFLEKCKMKSFMRYFKKDMPVIYHPFLQLLIFARLCKGMLSSFIKYRCQHFRKKFQIYNKEELLKILSFQKIEKNTLHKSETHEKPLLLITDDIALASFLVPRLLTLGQKLIVTFKDEWIDYHHPLLIWRHGNMSSNLWDLEGFDYSTAIIATIEPLPENTYTQLYTQLKKQNIEKLLFIGSMPGFSKDSYHWEPAENYFTQFCQTNAIAWTIFRVNPLRYGSGLEEIMASFAHFRKKWGCIPLLFPSKVKCQPIHNEDVAEAIFKSLSYPFTDQKTYTLSGGEVLSFRSMIACLCKKMGYSIAISEFRFLALLFALYGKLTKQQTLLKKILYVQRKESIAESLQAEKDFSFAPRPFSHCLLKKEKK